MQAKSQLLESKEPEVTRKEKGKLSVFGSVVMGGLSARACACVAGDQT